MSDSEMGDIGEIEMAPESPDEENDTTLTVVWPSLNKLKLFQQVRREGSSLTFKCLLCQPKTNLIKASTTSASNLRTYIKVSGLLYVFSILI